MRAEQHEDFKQDLALVLADVQAFVSKQGYVGQLLKRRPAFSRSSLSDVVGIALDERITQLRDGEVDATWLEKDMLALLVVGQAVQRVDQSCVSADSLSRAISQSFAELQSMIVDKNRRYGDSALNPVRVFSSASAIEQINVRLDDKLNRLIQGHTDDTEDTEKDLAGYLLLKQIYLLRAARIEKHG